MLSISDLTQCRSGGKWAPLVMYLLRDGQPQHYMEIKRQIAGISQKMLTQTLRQLEEQGFVERTVYPTVPPTTEYRLTPESMNLMRGILRIIDPAELNDQGD